jgi:hypothetical protein
MLDMQNRNNIVNELKEISPTVAQIGFENPYAAPAGYFEGLPEQVLARIQGGEELGSPVLPQQKVNPYDVPQGYFDNFAANLLQRIKAEEASTAKEELETLSPLLSGLSKKTPFSTPAGYFDELTDNAVAGAKAIDFVNEELENLSPLMSSLKGMNVYEVPAAYFEQLPAQMLQKAKSQPAKVVPMNFTRKVVRYAAAAVVAGLIVAAAWMYMGTKETEPDLAGIEQISDEALENYVETQTVSDPETTLLAANADMDEEDLKDMLADLSDEELENFTN